GDTAVTKLTAGKIENWHQSLGEQPALIPSKPGNDQRRRKSDGSPEAIPRRRTTANRVLTILKAALNHAWKVGQVVSDDAWRRTKPFKGVDTARVRNLTKAECVRVPDRLKPASWHTRSIPISPCNRDAVIALMT